MPHLIWQIDDHSFLFNFCCKCLWHGIATVPLRSIFTLKKVIAVHSVCVYWFPLASSLNISLIHQVEAVIDKIIEKARTGEIGDGKIFCKCMVLLVTHYCPFIPVDRISVQLFATFLYLWYLSAYCSLEWALLPYAYAGVYELSFAPLILLRLPFILPHRSRNGD